MRKLGIACVAAAAALFGISAAAPVTVTSYDMPNGETGSYTYWDTTYNGAGDASRSLAPLSGGTGELTDGTIANQGWVAAEQPAGDGPYVGWARVDPRIVFNFDQAYDIDRVTIYFDDADGFGGVDHISTVRVFDPNTNAFVQKSFFDPLGTGPASITIDFFADFGLSNYVREDLGLQLFGRNVWIMVSEVVFDGTAVNANPVPVPAAALLFGAALPLVFRKKK